MTYVGKKPADIIATAVDTTTGTFSGDLTVDTNTLYVDSANNRVGIGETSPLGKLHIRSSDASITSVNANSDDLIVENNGNCGISIASSTSGEGNLNFIDSGDTNIGRIQYTHSNNEMNFRVNDVERMRIDSSGNLLVGKTAISVATVGVEARADGIFASTRSGGESIRANRTSSDGDIIQLRKDNVVVGSIGNDNTTDLVITATDDIFFNVAGASNNILQLYGGSGANSQVKFDSPIFPLTDNTHDLGNSTERWQDLYLSGGVYLGGTGSANKLDDYEEGTFSVSVSTSGYTLTDSAGFYTKIGRQVTVVGFVKFDPVGSQNSAIEVSGLPFTSANLDNDIGYAGVGRESVVAGDIFVAQVTRGTSVFGMNSMDGVGSGQNQIFVANRTVQFNITYFTS